MFSFPLTKWRQAVKRNSSLGGGGILRLNIIIKKVPPGNRKKSMDLTRKKIFWRITKFSCVRHKYLILGTLILGGISAFLITRLQFQSDVLNLLREKKIPGPDYFQDLRIGLTGSHSIALEDSRMIKRELMINFSVSLVGVLTLFVLGFRRRIAIFYSSFPLLVSPLLTLGLFSSSLGRLIESTGAFSAIVLGLSIDFIILLYSRLEARVQEKMGEGQETIVVLTGSHRPEEALEVQGLLRSKFEQAMAAGLPISRYENLSAFIPPPSQQKRNLEWIEKRASAILNPIRLEKKLVQDLQEEGFRVEPFQPGLNMLREMLANREMLTWEQLPGTPLQALGERFLKRDGTLFGLRLFSMLGGASGLTQEGRLSWKT
jgi:hypothetical protein